jgi:hypothetical protein
LKKIEELERAPLGAGVYDSSTVQMTRDAIGMIRHGVTLFADADHVGLHSGSSAIDWEPQHG